MKSGSAVWETVRTLTLVLLVRCPMAEGSPKPHLSPWDRYGNIVSFPKWI